MSNGVHNLDPLYEFLHSYEHELVNQKITPNVLQAFCDAVWSYHETQRRDFAWRATTDPYAIVVSEIMLQQTQTQRVAEKYEQFLKTLPTFQALAQAPLSQVLALWVGLGYNRRALALYGIAQTVTNDYQGQLPNNPDTLQTFKGLGPATASSIVAFAFNKPTVFIETNVRAVYLHAFFKDWQGVHDKQLLPLVKATVDQKRPREWYYALMDCGVLLKKLYKNPSRKSKHHTKQSKFEGSERQIRGAIIQLATQVKNLSFEECQALFPADARVAKVLKDLCTEGFLVSNSQKYSISV